MRLYVPLTVISVCSMCCIQPDANISCAMLCLQLTQELNATNRHQQYMLNIYRTSSKEIVQ